MYVALWGNATKKLMIALLIQQQWNICGKSVASQKEF